MDTNITLIRQDNVALIAEQAPQAFSLNRQSHDRCLAAGRELLDRIKQQGMTAELDNSAAQFIEKARKTVAKMNAQRSPVTKLFDEIRTVFTTMENEVNPAQATSIPGQLQSLRNEYAARLRAEAEARRREEERRIRIESAREKFRQDVENDLRQTFNRYLNLQVNELERLNRSVTLDNYEEVYRRISGFPVELPEHFFAEHRPSAPRPVDLDASECTSIVESVTALLHRQFVEQCQFEMETNRSGILDFLPSKRKELEAIARASASEAEDRRREMEHREAEESLRREEERRRKEEEERQRQEAAARQTEMGALFNSAAAGVQTYTPKTQVKKRIAVTSPQGFLDILNLWWTAEGCKLSVDELAKKLKFALTLCERLANDKDAPRTIESPYIDYIDDIKAK